MGHMRIGPSPGVLSSSDKYIYICIFMDLFVVDLFCYRQGCFCFVVFCLLLLFLFCFFSP